MAYLQATSSNNQTADAAVCNAPAKIHGVILNPGSAASTLVLYDNASAASGNAVVKLVAAANTSSVTLTLDCPIGCSNGIYADVEGTSASYVVIYSRGA